MSVKRTAAIAGVSGGSRQLKQSKLSFGSSASTSRNHKPRPRIASEGPRDNSMTATINPTNAADSEKELPAQPDQSRKVVTATHDQTDNRTRSETALSPISPNQPQTQPPNPPTPSPNPSKIHITDKIGDLFAGPPNTLLIHACNTLGSWSGGIALAFRKHYPAAFRLYRSHCAGATPDQLRGTALLIPPQRGDRKADGPAAVPHYIGCLFTSRRYGRTRDSPAQILQATEPAMRHLLRLVAAEGREVGEVRMCRVNSGLFGVPWEESKAVMEGMELGVGEGGVEVVAYERE
ncbi:hypothetical protein BT67DRAFT_450424 [Trichocladium antarcticum]|uniref:ADP-ribose 1''-phosphate phosphatase n=1 Tax=Trichocladium antarcticum TaxID=1450529 RepID=A0AAN6UHF3_9PEZI|nr:hypothetical protein BT67DRAFT_450424 [Trichocladium antarcticum]